jgi:amidase
MDGTDEGMDRRGFLRLTSTAGAGALLLGASACVPRESPEGPAQWTRPFELEELSLSDLQSAMEEGRLTSRRITTLYLDRIERLDRRGPELRAILEVNPDAPAIAETLDREREERGPRGPLHGIPLVLKDNIDTADRTTTTAGSCALEGSTPLRDSAVARRLRRAGAVLLAKANLSEWANFRSTRSSSGWSARGGQGRNPYSLDRNPCGSSSGSASAVAANLCAAAIGTETNGSIVCPANANGIVGLKPTVGLVSRAGIIPIAHSQDTAGPMTRTVADAALLLGLLAGADPGDPATAPAAAHARSDYASALDPGALEGARVGVARQFFGFHEAVDRLMEGALEVLARQGAEVIDPTDIPTHRRYGGAELQVLLYEFKEDLNGYLSGLPAAVKVRSLEDLIRFNEENRDRQMPFFGQEILLMAREKGPLTSREYLEALATCRTMAREQGIDAVMDEHRLDAIVAPTGGPAWKIDLVNGDHFLGGSSSPAAVAGYPNITLPVGFVHGLPVGISFFGRPWSEARLLSLAYAFERVTQVRRPPGLVHSVDA